MESKKKDTLDILSKGEKTQIKRYYVLVEKKQEGGGRSLEAGIVFSKSKNASKSPRCNTPDFCCIVGWPTEQEAKAFAMALPVLLRSRFKLDAVLRHARETAQQARRVADAGPEPLQAIAQ